MNLDYFKENQSLVIACLLAGFVFGIITPMILITLKIVWDTLWDFVGNVLTFAVSKSYFIWFIITFQIAFEIFLLQQWIFVYAADSGDGKWDKYAYLPLTFVVPAFFGNIILFVASCCRLADCSEKEKR